VSFGAVCPLRRHSRPFSLPSNDEHVQTKPYEPIAALLASRKVSGPVHAHCPRIVSCFGCICSANTRRYGVWRAAEAPSPSLPGSPFCWRASLWQWCR
jgi:hypothetical protein